MNGPSSVAGPTARGIRLALVGLAVICLAVGLTVVYRELAALYADRLLRKTVFRDQAALLAGTLIGGFVALVYAIGWLPAAHQPARGWRRLLAMVVLPWARTCSWISEATGRATAWLTTLLVLLTAFNVANRYILGGQNRVATALRDWLYAWPPTKTLLHTYAVGMQDMQTHLFAAIFMLAAAYTLRHDRHVRVDVLYQAMPRRGKAAVNCLGILVLLAPFLVYLIPASLDAALTSFARQERSPKPEGLPALYIVRAIIPLSFSLLSLQAIAMLVGNVYTLFTGRPVPPHFQIGDPPAPTSEPEPEPAATTDAPTEDVVV